MAKSWRGDPSDLRPNTSRRSDIEHFVSTVSRIASVLRVACLMTVPSPCQGGPPEVSVTKMAGWPVVVSISWGMMESPDE
ncbi:MAG: hypothetical protein GC164_10245 [Phycisphaera sp.]|nr:hypothetical protein [Phycisphaera sp.]